MKRWEYYLVRRSALGSAGCVLDSPLNKFGRDGWELVQIINDPDCIGTFAAIFKRKLPKLNKGVKK